MKRVFLLSAAAILAGCGQPHTDDAHAHGAPELASFHPERGLLLAPEARAAQALTTEPVEERLLAAQTTVSAHVFATQPRVLARVEAQAESADHQRIGVPVDAELVDAGTSSTLPGGREMILALKRSPTPAAGDFVPVTFTTPAVHQLSVASSAVLETASGCFVYRVDGDAFRRTAVTVGPRTREFVAINDGLRAGDVVVTAGVENLWLTELRLTKGGGHSH